MSRESKLAKNTLVLSIGTFLPKLASFITLPVLTGCLTQEEYGTYDLITVLVSLLLPALTLQIQTAAFRFLIDKRGDMDEVKGIVTNIFIFIVGISSVSLVILFFCLSPVSFGIKFWICAYFMADILVNAARQIVRGLANNLSYSISAIISAVSKMILAVIVVWYLKMGLLGAVVALCISSCVSLIYLVIKEKFWSYIDITKISVTTLKKMIEYSWPMVPNSMSMWVMRVSDRFVITLFMGVSANAIYSVANKIPSLLTLAQSTFTMAWQENASMVSKDDDADLYYTSMFRCMYDLMAGIFGILIAATPLLFVILIRGNYAEAYYQIPILFLAMFFYSMSAFTGGIYVAYKKTKSVGVTTIVAAVFNLIIDLSAIKFIGLYAASGSTLISYIVLFVYRLIDVKKFVNLKYSLKHMISILLILILECIFCYMQNNILNIVNLIFGIIVFFNLNKALMGTLKKRIKSFRRYSIR